ncbi:MAG: response regulator transcription factor [Gammaproteobacteria bacterium]
MEEPRILWVDLRQDCDKSAVHEDLLNTLGIINVVNYRSVIEDEIDKFQPDVLCFDYDLPSDSGLRLLKKVRSLHPLLPIVILTQDHSVELAVWALRLRVWDYFTKPVGIDDLIASFAGLPKLSMADCSHKDDCWAMQPPSCLELQPYKTTAKKLSTALATSYIRQHLDSKISLDIVAKLCGMSRSHFSRSFKNDHGITFQEFIAQQRMDRALALLKDSDLQITQVAFAAGFAELSNFTRTFQRHIGMSPSYYRKAITSERLQNVDGQAQTVKFPKANPNPVLSVGPDGIPQFVNPAASYLVKEIGLQKVDNILPIKHTELVRQCRETGIPMSEERRIAGRTIVWSYCPMDDGDTVHLYGNDVSDYIVGKSNTESLSTANPIPVVSSERDGVPRYVNPATSQLLEELKLKNVEDILPPNHKALVRACIKTNMPLAEEYNTAGRTIVWSYRPTNNNDVIYIYGQTVSGEE